MELQKEKCVMVIDGSLPMGIAANTAAILGISLGRLKPEAVGRDVTDAGGGEHPGIITFPVPVLCGTKEGIREIRKKLYDSEYQDLTAVDFTDLAQGCRTYGEFTEKMEKTDEGVLTYLGIVISGDRKKINRLTGSMPLLR